MSEKTQAELEATAIKSIGSMLARLRWDKASTEERKATGRMLVKARKAKRKGGK